MKTIAAVYYPDFQEEYFDPFIAWVSTLPELDEILVFSEKSCMGAVSDHFKAISIKNIVIQADGMPLSFLLEKTAENSGDHDNVVFAWGDCPFYNNGLSASLFSQHVRYAAEYSYADGWPYGLVPEIMARGTLNILIKLGNGKKELYDARYSREALFNLIKADINSFEIETLISPVDFRMYRLEFVSSTKRGRLLCSRLEQIAAAKNTSFGDVSALELCSSAVKDPEVLHTLPTFYSIQVSEKCTGKCIYCPYPQEYRKAKGMVPSESCSFMKTEDFSRLIDKIYAFSEDAVIALSLWGESLYHPQLPELIRKVLSYPTLSVLVETTGVNVNEELCRSIKDVVEQAPARKGIHPPIIWIVSLDAVTEETYRLLHPESGFSLAEASRASELLASFFPGAVHVQMVRTSHNEKELEPFFRGHENRIIQKYNYFSGLLPQFKPADLSPVTRNECWHLRRDMSILSDGSVPLCMGCMFAQCMGNAFTDDLNDIWNKGLPYVKAHIDGNYPEICRNCDEYYTCNF